MTIHRLYVPEPLAAGAELRLDAERSHYVSRVLRARPGDTLVLFDGRGGEHCASISRISKQGATVTVGAHRDGIPESYLTVHLLQGISRGDRMDWVIQKATELGVARITPVLTELSVVRLDEDRAERRLAHWVRIAQGACEQCGRNRIPVIDPPRAFPDALASVTASTRIMLQPGASPALASREIEHDLIDLLIGPEGGLSDGEHSQAVAAGFVSCSLGPRVLRTETATIAALATLQARWGDWA